MAKNRKKDRWIDRSGIRLHILHRTVDMRRERAVCVRRGERIVRWVGVLGCQLFALYTVVRVMVAGRYEQLLMAAVTPLLIVVPWIAERLFRFRVSLPVFVFTLFYALGPMLGYCYNLYYTIPWWDKMLHVFGGVTFALLGLFLCRRFGRGQKRWMTAVFALCLSMAVAVGWEFFEYGMDTLFGMDMQDDTVITEITSYLLDGDVGQAGTIRDITAVTVNGTPLPVRGYIDVGLNDTMWDMLLETVGALAVVVWCVLTKGRYRPFRER